MLQLTIQKQKISFNKVILKVGCGLTTILGYTQAKKMGGYISNLETVEKYTFTIKNRIRGNFLIARNDDFRVRRAS